MGKWASDEQRAHAVALYEAGVFITDIAKSLGYGTTSIFRWVRDAGKVRPFGERIGPHRRGHQHRGKQGIFHTKRGEHWIQTDSNYEIARLIQLEDDAFIVDIDRCMDVIPYEFDGKKLIYCPDFAIAYADGSLVVEEVKPARYLSDPKVVAKTSAAAAYYVARSTSFRLVTERDIGQINLGKAEEHSVSRSDPAVVADREERRRKQKAAAQRTYALKKKEQRSPEDVEKHQATMAAYMRAHRAKRKAEAA